MRARLPSQDHPAATTCATTSYSLPDRAAGRVFAKHASISARSAKSTASAEAGTAESAARMDSEARRSNAEFSERSHSNTCVEL